MPAILRRVRQSGWIALLAAAGIVVHLALRWTVDGASATLPLVVVLAGGGTPLVPALENAADAIGNRSVSLKVMEVVPKVREGRELWRALEQTGIFTDLTIEMIKVGESSGALEEMLSSVSEFYDEEIDVMLARVISFVEPAILVLMGGVIVTILLSVYLPMFRLMSAIKS